MAPAVMLVLIRPAGAFEIGPVSVPGWMDYYLLLLLLLAVPVWGLVMLTKPRGVRLFALASVTGGRLAKFFYRVLKGILLLFSALMGLGLVLMLGA